MMAAAINAHSRMPHQVLYGMIFPPKEKLVIATEMARAISCMTIKNFQVMVESPDTKQRRSSGKMGRINMTVRMLLSFPLTFCSHESSVSRPTSHAAAR